VHVTQTLGDRRDFFVAQRDPGKVVRVIVEVASGVNSIRR